MRRFYAIMTAVFLLSGCAKKDINEKQFKIIWNEYQLKGFEESLDEAQSIAQREKIFREILSRHGVDLNEFKFYMKKNHGDKFNKIFLNR